MGSPSREKAREQAESSSNSQAVGWARNALDYLLSDGCDRQGAINEILVAVAQKWDPESAWTVAKTLNIRFEVADAPPRGVIEDGVR